MHTPLPYRVHSDSAQQPRHGYHIAAKHPVEIGHRIYTILLLQLCEQTPQSVGMRIFGFEINAEHNQIGRRIDKERRLRLLGQKYEPGSRIAATHGVDHRNGHGYISESGEAHHQHIAGKFLFIFWHKAQGWWPGRCTSSSAGTPSCICVRLRCLQAAYRWPP